MSRNKIDIDIILNGISKKAETVDCPDYLTKKIFALIDKGCPENDLKKPKVFSFFKNKVNGKYEMINVPFVGLVSCGQPNMVLDGIQESMLVSTEFARPPYKYFLLKAKGDSMNKAGINDGDIVLIRQESIATDGDIVVAFIDGEATLKEYHYTPSGVILRPRSENKAHKDITLKKDSNIQGIFVNKM